MLKILPSPKDGRQPKNERKRYSATLRHEDGGGGEQAQTTLLCGKRLFMTLVIFIRSRRS
jgi:hypothetical protein